MTKFDDAKKAAIDFGEEQKNTYSGMDSMERKLWLITVVFVAVASPMVYFLIKKFFF